MLGVEPPLSPVLTEKSYSCSTLVLNHNLYREEDNPVFMANTAELTKEERKKSKRAARKKSKAEKPKKPRDYARGSKKRKVKKLARGQSKR
jgi:hypothetical protein